MHQWQVDTFDVFFGNAAEGEICALSSIRPATVLSDRANGAAE
jgi:hypothetical protein